LDPATGDLYSVGVSVRRSSDQGATWQPADSFAYSSSGVAADGMGNIFVAGNAADASGYLHWIIRKSSNRGATWTNLLDLSTRRQNCKPNGICYVPGRGLFVVGRVADKWTVQRKRDTETTFTTVDTWTAAKNGASLASGIVSDSQGNIFVCGATGTSWNPIAWVVRGSTDGGTKWTTILDRWYAGYSGVAEDIALDPTSGDIWLAGYQKTSSSRPADWTVAYLDRASGWTLIPEVPIGGDGVSVGRATGIVTDMSGSVYVVGRFIDVMGSQHWIVQRRLSNQTP
jgi:hypothetical protein